MDRPLHRSLSPPSSLDHSLILPLWSSHNVPHPHILLGLQYNQPCSSLPPNLGKTSCSKPATGTARNKNRGYLRGTVVKTFGRLYNEFLPTKRSIMQENGVRRAHEVPTRQGARPVVVGAPSTLVEASCPSRTASYFSIFLNIPKRRNIALKTVLESVYLPYHIPIPFRSLKRSGKCPLCIPPGLRFQ